MILKCRVCSGDVIVACIGKDQHPICYSCSLKTRFTYGIEVETWTAVKEDNGISEDFIQTNSIFLESSDVTHDVRLYIDGDFADDEQKLEYAKKLAERLNNDTIRTKIMV